MSNQILLIFAHIPDINYLRF